MAKIGVYTASPNAVDNDPIPVDIVSGGGGGGGDATDASLQQILTAIGTTNTKLDTLNTDVDGLEGLVTNTNSKLDILAPSASAEAITPSNSVNLSGTTRGIYVGVTGDVTAVINGNAILFKAVPVGLILPIRATRVNSTGTTATNMVALY